MSKEQALLPCPICLGDAEIFWDPDEEHQVTWHRAQCRKNCVSTRNFTDAEQAIEVWNTRTRPDAGNDTDPDRGGG